MSSIPPPQPPPNSSTTDPSPSTPSPVSARANKLQKIPHILNRHTAVISSSNEVEEGEEDNNNNNSKNDDEEQCVELERADSSSSILLASSLGLNHIRTRFSSPLRHSSSAGAPSFIGKDAVLHVAINNVAKSKFKSSHPKDLGIYTHSFFSLIHLVFYSLIIRSMI